METTQLSATEVATAIKQSFASLPTRLGRGRTNREWTRQLKEDIGTLGTANGWQVCTSGFAGQFDCEWLYDLVWYRNDHGNLSEVYLVLESEWQEDDFAIKYDFEKLLLAKAALKVMVFQAYDQNISALLISLEQGVRAFQKGCADETYILAAFNNTTFTFVVRQISVP